MKPLFDINQIENYHYEDYVPLQCYQCGNEFKNKVKWIRRYLADYKHHKQVHKFCSKKCAYLAASNTIIQPCGYCYTMIEKLNCEIKSSKSGYVFCNNSCAAKYNNSHKSHGTRRSKLERWLEEQLLLQLPNLTFHFNSKKELNTELDIYIPELKLAFEINGIFHYSPIYGVEKFEAIQANDKLKIQTCQAANIQLEIIDVSNQKYFTHKSSLQYLTLITGVIRNKIQSSDS